MIDLKTFAVYGNRQPIDLVNGEIGVHSAPTVTKSGIVLVGSSFREGGTPKTHNNTKGMVLAFDDYYCWSSDAIAGERRAMLEFFRDSRWNLLPFVQYSWGGMSFVVEDASLLTSTDRRKASDVGRHL